jgi:hypothetical protein
MANFHLLLSLAFSYQKAFTTSKFGDLRAGKPRRSNVQVTGLTLSDVLYKAQMIRVQSLLLRSAVKEGGLLGGPPLGGQLSESPFLLHPKERQTAGLYNDPVVSGSFSCRLDCVLGAR